MKTVLRTAALAFSLGVALTPALAFADLSSTSILALANNERAERGLGTLTMDARLAAAAQKKADDMATRGYFSHTSPQGKKWWDFITASGYRYFTAGENLAQGFSDADTLNSAWMRSPSHRANILKSRYTRIGIGISSGMYEGRPTTFVVEFFALPASRTTQRAASVKGS